MGLVAPAKASFAMRRVAAISRWRGSGEAEALSIALMGFRVP